MLKNQILGQGHFSENKMLKIRLWNYLMFLVVGQSFPSFFLFKGENKLFTAILDS